MIGTMMPAMLGFLLLAGHAVADYPLQGDFLATAKDRYSALGQIFWPHALTCHALIHGGMVALLTGSVSLGIAETVAHWFIDLLKCENRIGLNTDQALHVICKLVWLAVVVGPPS